VLKHKKSNRKLAELLHTNFLSHQRMREWRDIHGQLAGYTGELGMLANQTPASFEQIHRALLAGLLGNIGFKNEEGEYLGARAIKFAIFPGSVLRKASPNGDGRGTRRNHAVVCALCRENRSGMDRAGGDSAGQKALLRPALEKSAQWWWRSSASRSTALPSSPSAACTTADRPEAGARDLHPPRARRRRLPDASEIL